MANDTLKHLVFGLVFFVIFASLILTVAVDFGSEHGKDLTHLDGSLNLSLFEDSANSVEGNASAFRTSFESGKVDDVDDASGIFATAKKFINLITTPFKLIAQILENQFGVPPLFTTGILGLLAIGLILAIWSVLRKGD